MKLQAISTNPRPTKEEAEEAVRTLIRWAGDDPYREGLIETPRRVTESYNEFFCGYSARLDNKICKTFPNNSEYDEIIILKDIRLESFCEHHMLPIIGRASVAYIPNDRIIGLSKLARIVEHHAKKLQVQERLVVDIAKTLNEIVNPKGVGVTIECSHQCLTMRGIHKPGSLMRTNHFLGIFREKDTKKEFLSMAYDSTKGD